MIRLLKDSENEKVLEARVLPLSFENDLSYLLIINDQTEFQRIEVERIKKTLQNMFVKTISHELRTPLNGILVNFELIHMQSDEKSIQELALDGKRSGRMLLHLVENANSMAKMETHTLQPKYEDCKIEELVENCMDLIEREIKQKSLDVKVDIDSSVPEIICTDPSFLSQILTCVLVKAAKYTFRGFITLNINYNKLEKNHYFSVKDTGTGIPKERLPNLFKMFCQNQDSELKHGI